MRQTGRKDITTSSLWLADQGADMELLIWRKKSRGVARIKFLLRQLTQSRAKILGPRPLWVKTTPIYALTSC